MNEKLVDRLFELIRSASTDLPADVEGALRRAKDREPEGSTPANTFGAILDNVRMARENGTPICQDTGSLVFYVHHPVGTDTIRFREAIEKAAERATKEILLRPNAVDPVTGKNTGTNIGVNAPYVSFKPWRKDEIEVRLMLKGGGSENVGTQYKLPDGGLGAGRDLEGVRKCVLDAIFKAQGMGCAPGIAGVGIGGDRATSFLLSKEQFFRELGSRNPDPELDALEKRLHRELNELGIGPMGFGGKTTVLGAFVGKQHRHPATFYVAVSYMCWACRRKAMTLCNGEVRHD
ncbi:MAG: fumarate hydratase [Candidatus Eisenbacteria bacterium]